MSVKLICIDESHLQETEVLMDSRPIILGHRGMGIGDGENSLLSLIKAVQIGADGVELDVQITSDGVLVVNHDPDLKRTFGADVVVGETTFKNLKKMNLVNPEGLTTLEEVYLELPETAYINVEIKDPRAADVVVPLVKSFNAMDRTLFSSFHHDCMRRVKECDIQANIGLLIGEEARGKNPAKYFEELMEYKPFSFNLPVQLFDEIGFELGVSLIDFVRSRGIKVALWTLNDPGLLMKIKGEADIIITDNLQGIMAALGGKSERR
ncbi:glycerophosphodiester phosphodiesterase family protein [Mesotoga sp.]|uniref:glycerophosphodiester phosphodiesterase family protein n=2 Tax=Mesotoga TaxID=1184396 RepID=UPI00345EAE2D